MLVQIRAAVPGPLDRGSRRDRGHRGAALRGRVVKVCVP